MWDVGTSCAENVHGGTASAEIRIVQEKRISCQARRYFRWIVERLRVKGCSRFGKSSCQPSEAHVKSNRIMASEKIPIALGADHAGYRLKERLRAYLSDKGYQVEDLGTHSEQSADYPDFAARVAEQVQAQKAKFGVLVCGTGIGMAMAANKMPGIRASACNDTLAALMSRSHNDANILTLGSRTVDEPTARKILDVWLSTPFAGGRHQRRVRKIQKLENH